MNKNSKNPPKFILQFFRWFCHPNCVEDIEGDLTEQFYKRLENSSANNAKFGLIWGVIKLFRFGIIRPLGGAFMHIHLGLLKHNLLISQRVLVRDSTYSLLNILGLGLSMAASFFIFLYVSNERAYDNFHKDNENLYRITTSYARTDEPIRKLAPSPPSLLTLIKEKLPEVDEIIRVYKYPWDLIITHEQKKFRENSVLFVGPTFLAEFNFPVLAGDPATCLSKIQTLVITEKAASRYFANENPIGKTMTFDGAPDPYLITAVVANPPQQSHLQFDFLVSYETIDSWWDGEAKDSWEAQEFYGYVRLNENTNPDVFSSKLHELYNVEQGEANAEEGINQYFQLQPLASIHLQSDLENELEPNLQGDKFTLDTLYVIGWLILIIAWINYINLAMSRTLKRATEVGLRKAIGAKKNQLILQFITEAFLINFLAFCLGLVIIVISMKYFNLVTYSFFKLDVLLELSFWKWAALLLLAGSLISGFYPAIILSSHQTRSITAITHQAKNSSAKLRKILVVFQFTASTALITGTVLIYQQLLHMKQADLGLDLSNVMLIKGPNHNSSESDSLMEGKYDYFINELKNKTLAQSVTACATLPGELLYDAAAVRRENESKEQAQSFNYTWGSYDFFSTFDIPILHGRSFDPAFNDDRSVLLNEKAALRLGCESASEAVGLQITLGRSSERTVIGVVKNFSQESPHRPVSPMVIDFGGAPANYYAMRFSGDYNRAIAVTAKLFESVYPRDPFDFYFLDDFYNRQYYQEDRLSKVIILFAVVAILIACLGLFGIASYNILQRMKEISIRKVLGAQLKSLLYLLLNEYLILILVANIIAAPFVYYFISDWLQGFAMRITMGISPFFTSSIMVILVALATVSAMIIRIAKSNPVESLKHE